MGTLKGTSFGAKCVSIGMRTLVCLTTVFTGESILRTSMYRQQKPYRFGKWKVPQGYTNKEIHLEHCRGYYLEQGADRVMYQIHGGGYVAQFSDLYNETALHFAKITGANVFSLDYRTAPVNVYPSALEDAIAGYHWLLKEGYAAKDIYFCGESAGGGLCLALGLWLRDHGEALPAGMILSSPWTDMTASGRSYQTKKTEDHFFGYPKAEKVPKYPVPIVYAGEHDPKDPYLSPVYGDYQGFPPLLIQTGEAELLLSDSDTVVAQAKKAGVNVTYYTYPGMYHTFYITHPNLPESKLAWERIAAWFAR